MSWAANNPEAYDEICVSGIVDALDFIDAERDEATFAIDQIRNHCPKAFTELCNFAAKQIAEAEAARHTRGL